MTDPKQPEQNGSKLRIILPDGTARISEPLIMQVGEGRSKRWDALIKGKRSARINFSAFRVESAPKIYESEVEYYYRRGNKYFFKLGKNKISIEAKNNPDLKKLKYGKYPGKFTLA